LQRRPHSRSLAQILLPLVFSGLSCLPKREQSITYATPLLTTDGPIQPADVTALLQELCGDPAFTAALAAVATTPIGVYWEESRQGVAAGSMQLVGRTIHLSPTAIATVTAKQSAAQVLTAARYGNVASYLKANQIDEKRLETSDFTAAWLTLATLLSGDESLITATPPSSLGLIDSIAKTRDIIRIAKIGKRAYDSNGNAIAAAMDPETWRLIDRNRKVLNLAINVAQKLKPQNPKVQRYAKIVKHLMTASDIITGLQEALDFQPSSAGLDN